MGIIDEKDFGVLPLFLPYTFLFLLSVLAAISVPLLLFISTLVFGGDVLDTNKFVHTVHHNPSAGFISSNLLHPWNKTQRKIKTVENGWMLTCEKNTKYSGLQWIPALIGLCTCIWTFPWKIIIKTDRNFFRAKRKLFFFFVHVQKFRYMIHCWEAWKQNLTIYMRIKKLYL